MRHAALRCTLLVALTATTGTVALAQTEAQREAIRTDCRSDYIAHCSSIQPGGAESLQCLARNMSSLAPSCQAAVRAVEASVAPKQNAPAATPAAPPPAAAAKAAPKAAPAAPARQKAGTPAPGPAATAAATPAPEPLLLRKMLPREELFVTNSACRTDISTLCRGVVPGGGRIMQCLQVRSVSLSPECRDVLAPFATQ